MLCILFVTLLTKSKVVTSLAVETVRTCRNSGEATITCKPCLIAIILLLLFHLLLDSFGNAFFVLLRLDHCFVIKRTNLFQLSRVIQQLVVDVLLIFQVTRLLVFMCIVLIVKHLVHSFVVHVRNKVCLQFLFSFVQNPVVFKDVATCHEFRLFQFPQNLFFFQSLHSVDFISTLLFFRFFSLFHCFSLLLSLVIRSTHRLRRGFSPMGSKVCCILILIPEIVIVLIYVHFQVTVRVLVVYLFLLLFLVLMVVVSTISVVELALVFPAL